ncbi:MAG TPA: glycosyltransferase [Longimicrobium sp.]
MTDSIQLPRGGEISFPPAPGVRRAAPLRVLFVTTVLGGGGAEKHMVRVANALDRTRFTPSILTFRGGGDYEREVAPDVELHVTGSRRLRALRMMREMMGSGRYDVVCAVQYFPGCLATAASVGLPDAPPVVNVLQAVLSRLTEPGTSLKRRGLLVLMRRLFPRAARVVALSRGVGAEAEAMIPGLAGRVEVIHNAALDEETQGLALAPLPREAPAGEGPLLVACGRLSPEKGFVDLLRAVAKVRAQVPARLWIIGEGPLRPELEAEVARLGLGGAVWLAGFQQNPFRFMHAADVFVLSSTVEAFGNVVVEAMAGGTAVVATDCRYGPGEIIRHGETGMLVPVADPDAMAGAILQLLRDPELRARVAERGRVRAHDFASPAIAEAYGRVFTQVAAGRTRKAG